MVIRVKQVATRPGMHVQDLRVVPYSPSFFEDDRETVAHVLGEHILNYLDECGGQNVDVVLEFRPVAVPA